MAKLTNLDIGILTTPRGVKRITFTSTMCKGLTLLVQPHKKTWLWRYTRLDGRRNSVTVGYWPEMDEKKAAEEAGGMRARLKSGIDPVEHTNASKRQARAQQFFVGSFIDTKWRLSHLAAEYLEHCEKILKPETVKTYRRLINAHVLPAVGGVDIRALSIPEWQEHVHAIAKRSEAAAFNSNGVLRAMLSYAVETGRIQHNPLLGKARLVKKFKPEPRDRVLSSSELNIFLNEIDEQPISMATLVALPLQLYTGLRIGEVCELRWERIDFRKRVIKHPRSETKAHISCETVMTNQIRRLLLEWKMVVSPSSNQGRVFPDNFNTQFVGDELRKIGGWLNFASHDLRRTMRTRLQNMGCPEEVRKMLTNHEVKSGASKHYDHAEMLSIQLNWLTIWNDALDRVTLDPDALTDNIAVKDDDPLLAEFADIL